MVIRDSIDNQIDQKMIAIRTIVIIFLLFSAAMATGQKVFEVKYKSEADVVIYVTTYQSDADLKVYVTKYESDAKGMKGIWYFTKYESDADLKIFYTKYKSEANWVIYFTEYKSDAGCKKK